MDQIRNQGPIGIPGDKLGDNEKKDFQEALSRLNSQPVGNLPNASVGATMEPGGSGLIPVHINPDGLRGYGVDLNGNEQYDRGQDAVLGFDSNRDGKLDQQEITATNNILSAWGGDSDFNHDGMVDKGEQIRGAGYRAKYAGLDKDKDGKLSNEELHAAGAKAWVDKDKDGQVDGTEVESIDRVHSNSLFPKKIEEVDPNGQSRTSKQPLFKEKKPWENPGFFPRPDSEKNPPKPENPWISPGFPRPTSEKPPILDEAKPKPKYPEDTKLGNNVEAAKKNEKK